MTLTSEKLKKVSSKLAEHSEAVIAIFAKYEINTLNRVAGFLAQCAHESGTFSITKENLNYSAAGLLKIFKKYFTEATAAQYARKPEMIANKVYANRMGNGDEKSGDGFRYRGRGFIQLTGKENYSSFAKSINKTLDETIAYLETFEGAIESACWYWKSRNLNATCDKNDIISMTEKINGGTIGLEDRKAKYEKYKSLLA